MRWLSVADPQDFLLARNHGKIGGSWSRRITKMGWKVGLLLWTISCQISHRPLCDPQILNKNCHFAGMRVSAEGCIPACGSSGNRCNPACTDLSRSTT